MYNVRLKQQYAETIRKALIDKFGYSNVMQVPRITKICMSQGLGKRAVQDKKVVEVAAQELSMIVGQKAVVTYAKKDISNFKLRKGMPIGVKVTLRGDKMYEFLDRLICIALPRTRDFRGIPSKGFDGRGNFTFGIQEQIIFPEIDIEKIKEICGMDITIVTSAQTNREAHALLEMIGLPFEKK